MQRIGQQVGVCGELRAVMVLGAPACSRCIRVVMRHDPEDVLPAVAVSRSTDLPELGRELSGMVGELRAVEDRLAAAKFFQDRLKFRWRRWKRICLHGPIVEAIS